MAKNPERVLDAGADFEALRDKPRAYFDTVDWPARFPERWKRAVWRSGGDEVEARERLAGMHHAVFGDVPDSERCAPMTPEDVERHKLTIRRALAAYGWDVRKFARAEYRRGSTKRMTHYLWRGFWRAAGLI